LYYNNFNNSLVIDEFGHVFGWGDNSNERLGFKSELSEEIRTPKKFEFFSEMKKFIFDISMGGSHIVVIAKDKEKGLDDFGDVYTWGLDHGGRLGYVTENILNNDEELDDGSKTI